jgi:alkaline phosphatase
MVEGGKIDQAHHQNHARLALEEFVEFEKAVKKAVEMTGEDTLIIVTSDHAHAMVYNGYGKRGNDILGFGNKQNSTAYETLVYATGPGFFQHLANKTRNGNEGPFISMDNFSGDMRRSPLYMHSSLIPMKDAVHR